MGSNLGENLVHIEIGKRRRKKVEFHGCQKLAADGDPVAAVLVPQAVRTVRGLSEHDTSARRGGGGEYAVADKLGAPLRENWRFRCGNWGLRCGKILCGSSGMRLLVRFNHKMCLRDGLRDLGF